MKKFFFMAAMASVALASCVNDVSDVAAEQQKEINFAAPVVGNLSRVDVIGEIGTSYDTDESFSVYAVWHESSFDKWEGAALYMSNVEVNHVGTDKDNTSAGTGAWVANPTYYWPKVGVLSFAAYSPTRAKDDGTITYTKDGLQIQNFQVRPNGQQYDLMYSERTINQSASRGENNTYDGVDIKFKHALSSIKFTAKTDADYSSSIEIKIKKISLWGMYSKATFNQTITDGTSDLKGTPEWNTYKDDSKILGSDPYIAYSGTLQLNHTTAQEANTNAVILLPQTFSDENAKIRVDYTIKSLTGVEINQYKEVCIKDLSGEWTYGYRYTYNITIGLDEVYFAPSVELWADQGGVGGVGL